MIAELAAANAAFDVIKQTIQNGQEIYAAGEELAKYFGLKNEIQKKAHEHGYKSDLSAFMAAEQLKEQEKELKEMMIYQGRGGMWNDWLQFQAEMKQSREEEEKEKKRAKLKRKKKLIQTLQIVGGSIALIALCGGMIWGFILLLAMKAG
jgi:molecular chaperone GrpE (heat shock protein)